MKRKLVKQGVSTLMISLPSKWTKANKLDKGDEVDLMENNNNIVIGTSMKEKKELSIDINENNKRDIKNIITHAYRRGFDKITLTGKYRDIQKELRDLVSELLLGFEITNSSSNTLVIEDISEPTGQKFDLMLKKCFQIIEETHSLILEDFKENRFDNMSEIESSRKQHDRFLLFCRRSLIRENTGKNIISNWEVINFLMHIEHLYYYMYEYASKNKIINEKNIMELLKYLKEYFALFSNAYLNSDMNAIHRINALRNEYYFGRCINYLEKSKGKNTVILAYLRELYRLIQIGTSPILNELLERKF